MPTRSPDHGEHQRVCEVLHDVGPVCVGHPVQRAVHQARHPVGPREDAARVEHGHHQVAQPGVVGRVHVQHRMVEHRLEVITAAGLRSSGPDRACPRHGLSYRHCPLRHPDRRMVVRRSFTGPTCDFHGIVEDWTDTGDQAMGRLPFSPRTPGQLARPSEGVARQRVHWHLNVQSLLHIRVSEIVMLLQWRRYLGSCWGITWPERDPRPCLPPCRGWGMGQARVRKGQI
jgi:hypothetical protein